MFAKFILHTQDTDTQVARKCYMSLPQANQGFAKAAKAHLGDCAAPITGESGLYYRNPRGDVLTMVIA